MEEHLHKGWYLSGASAVGTVGAWVANHWMGLAGLIITAVSALYAIRASAAAKRSSEAKRIAHEEATRLTRLQIAQLTCVECMQDGIRPHVCPHPPESRPKQCPLKH